MSRTGPCTSTTTCPSEAWWSSLRGGLVAVSRSRGITCGARGRGGPVPASRGLGAASGGGWSGVGGGRSGGCAWVGGLPLPPSLVCLPAWGPARLVLGGLLLLVAPESGTTLSPSGQRAPSSPPTPTPTLHVLLPLTARRLGSECRTYAYHDTPLPIGYGETISGAHVWVGGVGWSGVGWDEQSLCTRSPPHAP